MANAGEKNDTEKQIPVLLRRLADLEDDVEELSAIFANLGRHVGENIVYAKGLYLGLLLGVLGNLVVSYWIEVFVAAIPMNQRLYLSPLILLCTVVVTIVAIRVYHNRIKKFSQVKKQVDAYLDKLRRARSIISELRGKEQHTRTEAMEE